MKNQKTDVLANDVRWDLSELFSDISDPNIETTLKKTIKSANEFAFKYRQKIAQLSSKELLICFQEMEHFLGDFYKVDQFVNLKHSIDTSDEKIKTLLEKIDDLSAEFVNLILFLKLELGKLKREKFQEFLLSPELKDYRYYLELIKKNAKYHLSEKEEKIINLKSLTSSVSAKKLYQVLTSSFEFKFKLEGEIKTLNGSELRNLRHHSSPTIRRSAMKLFFQKYQENETVLNYLFSVILKDYEIEKDLRGFKTSIQVMNVHNDLENKVVDVLHKVTTESNFLVERYYQLKQKILDLPQMTLADIYAPLPQSKKYFSWDSAKEIVLTSLEKFDHDFYLKANLMFEQKRIDAPIELKKRGGAYCSSSLPSLNPYVLLNFLGKERDVSTMAHELGHAIHSQYSKKQNLFNFSAILPLAETASVFCEMLITDYFLQTEKDKMAKISLLTSKLEDIFATSHRQNMFSRFEMMVHKLIMQQRITSQEFCEIYLQELKLMFGKAVKYTPEYNWEWASIPHMFEMPFYVYAYNFGNLLVLAMYQKYLEEGASFIPKYQQFLSMGSSASPRNIANIMGIDFSSAQFWQKSIKYIEKMLDNLENLVKK